MKPLCCKEFYQGKPSCWSRSWMNSQKVGDPIPVKWPGHWVACGVGDVAICHRVTAACQLHWTVGDPWGTKDIQGCNVLVLQYHEPACLIDCGPSPKVEALNVSMEDLSLLGWMSSPACWTPFAETCPMWSVREYGTFTRNYWDDVCPRQDSQAWVLHEDNPGKSMVRIEEQAIKSQTELGTFPWVFRKFLHPIKGLSPPLCTSQKSSLKQAALNSTDHFGQQDALILSLLPY